MQSTSAQLIAAAKKLGRDVGRLKFGPPVTHVYNPLDYAWDAHEEYLRKFGGGTKHVVFLGMNPGPFGMVQTGVPFGEIAAVRDWLGIQARIGTHAQAHPKRPVLGFDCARSEVSGRRLWNLFAQRFGTAGTFFKEHFVMNYCPLAFCLESGGNQTPDKLSASERDELFRVCDEHLSAALKILQPEWVIGVGGFAKQRVELAVADPSFKIGLILHPSPANPRANRVEWAKTATAELMQQGVWRP